MLLSNGKCLLNSRDAKDYLGEQIGYSDVDGILNIFLEDGEFISQEEYEQTTQEYKQELAKFEQQADYYTNTLIDAKEEIESIIDYIHQAKRLNKQKIINYLQQICDNIQYNT